MKIENRSQFSNISGAVRNENQQGMVFLANQKENVLFFPKFQQVEFLEQNRTPPGCP